MNTILLNPHQLLKKARNYPEFSNITQTSQYKMVLQLPNELIVEVVSYLDNVSDIFSLLMTSKDLSTIIQPEINKVSQKLQETAALRCLPLLHHAVNINSCPAAKLALKLNPDDVNQHLTHCGTALHVAAGKGKPEMVKLLLDNHADPNLPRLSNHFTTTALNIALHTMRFQSTAAGLYSVPYNFRLIVRDLLQAGADPSFRNNNGADALHQAASQTNLELLHLIFDNSNVNINSVNQGGNTALHLVAGQDGWRAENVGHELLSHGIAVNAVNNFNETALFWCSNRYLVALLMEYGVDPNALNYRSRAVFHYYAEMPNYQHAIDLIAILFSRRRLVRIRQLDDDGHTARDLAVRCGNIVLVHMIDDYCFKYF